MEDTAAQVSWASLPDGGLVLEAGDSRTEVVSDGRPGAVALDSLPADTSLELTVEGSGLPRRRVGRFRTLRAPPGRLLARFATVNDLHIGERSFGVFHRLRDDGRPAGEPYSTRCARAAVSEAVAWGAQVLVAKGDLTWGGRPRQWEGIGEVLRSAGVPVHAVLGNHDTVRRATDGRKVLSELGVDIREEPWAVDLAGIRIVLIDSTWPGHSRGRLDEERRRHVARLVVEGRAPAFVALHHYPQPFTLPHIYPAGLPAANALARRALPRPFNAGGHRPQPPSPSAPQHPGPRGRGRGHPPLPRHVGRLRRARGRDPPGGAAGVRPRGHRLDGADPPGAGRSVGVVGVGAPGRPLLHPLLGRPGSSPLRLSMRAWTCSRRAAARRCSSTAFS